MRSVFFCAALACVVSLAGMSSAPAQNDNLLNLERLEFKWEKPKTVVIYPGSEEAGKGNDLLAAGRIYWYLPYTLSNKGKTSAKFFVSLRAKTDKNRTYSDLALPKVEKKIERVEQRRMQSKADLLNQDNRDENKYSEFAAGESRKCVAIFNPLDPEADTITVNVHGLINDLKIENLGEGRFRIEERVLQLTFKRPGDEIYPTLDRITFEGKKWITITQETPASK